MIKHWCIDLGHMYFIYTGPFIDNDENRKNANCSDEQNTATKHAVFLCIKPKVSKLRTVLDTVTCETVN